MSLTLHVLHQLNALDLKLFQSLMIHDEHFRIKVLDIIDSLLFRIDIPESHSYLVFSITSKLLMNPVQYRCKDLESELNENTHESSDLELFEEYQREISQRGIITSCRMAAFIQHYGQSNSGFISELIACWNTENQKEWFKDIFISSGDSAIEWIHQAMAKIPSLLYGKSKGKISKAKSCLDSKNIREDVNPLLLAILNGLPSVNTFLQSQMQVFPEFTALIKTNARGLVEEYVTSHGIMSQVMAQFPSDTHKDVFLKRMKLAKLSLLSIVNHIIRSFTLAEYEELGSLLLMIADQSNAVEADAQDCYLISLNFLLDLDISFNLLSFLQEQIAKLQQKAMESSSFEFLAMSLENMLMCSGLETVKKRGSAAPRDLQSDGDTFGQIKSLFPDYSDEWIQICLDYFGNNVEMAVARILDQNLPHELSMAVSGYSNLKDERKSDFVDSQNLNQAFIRQNVFNHDEFDVFHSESVPMDKIIFGKKKFIVEPEAEDAEIKEKQKQWVLEQDAYDDDYDDSFDVTAFQSLSLKDFDVVSESGEAESVEARLVKLYMADPSLFEVGARKRKDRALALKDLNLSAEQFEGWFKMLERNPKKNQFLDRFGFQGNQKVAIKQSQGSKDSQATDSAPRNYNIASQSSPENSIEKTSSENKSKPPNFRRKRGNQRKQAHDRKMSKMTGI